MKGVRTSSPPAMQGAPSLYALLGALQSALCFFVLPPLCKPLWPVIFSDLSPQIREVLLWAITAPYFVMYALVVALPPYLLEWDFFEQFKISKEPWPWKDERANVRREFWTLTYKSICIDSINILVLLPCCVYAKTIAFPRRAPSFSADDWPTHWESFSGVVASIVLHEFGFYWTHRIMHARPGLYRFHKVHHQYKQNDVLSAQHFHPVDFFFSIAAPALLTAAVVRPHSFTQALAGLWIFHANMDDHLGYAFPWSPVRWFPFSAGTDAHEFHHSVNMGCYGSKLSLWDWVFKTDRVYEQW
eukprot:CAMPEP_0172552888 /NCGR_PEP_ID=MMETSP1067-20121228/47249_1 /TAXON_ID=265564 ORGANISM="Thalassiosira punctigera, Strain Tpunct2005C2" /NCGR_SAMPLE_ID=MMETSP1067 /ASSEMBLY_ACC=CAM_ASM_000444 /LENGTH=300 /DNA_ID=CAMNT_0013340961 /DNA_START=70 /DNA_END=969 /DNA_ORIENTATION=-